MNPKKLPKEIFYLRGVIRNRLSESGNYYSDPSALLLLGNAYMSGVSIAVLNDIVRSLNVKCWTMFRQGVESAVSAVENAKTV